MQRGWRPIHGQAIISTGWNPLGIYLCTNHTQSAWKQHETHDWHLTVDPYFINSPLIFTTKWDMAIEIDHKWEEQYEMQTPEILSCVISLRPQVHSLSTWFLNNAVGYIDLWLYQTICLPAAFHKEPEACVQTSLLESKFSTAFCFQNHG